MTSMITKTMVHATLVGALLAVGSVARAQVSEPMLQGAKVYGIGNTVYLYNLPVKAAADGKVRYFDAQLVLEAHPTSGRPNGVSLANVAVSPTLRRSDFILGSYTFGSVTCQLTASPFSGRTEYELNCTDAAGRKYIGSFYSGPVAGHPYEAALVAAKLDTIVGSTEYAWGKSAFDYGTNWFGCFNAPELLAARQVGNTLTLINFAYDSVEDCRVNLTRP